MENLVIVPVTETPAIRVGLRDLLVDVVDHGGLVHFMAPLAPAAVVISFARAVLPSTPAM